MKTPGISILCSPNTNTNNSNEMDSQYECREVANMGANMGTRYCSVHVNGFRFTRL